MYNRAMFFLFSPEAESQSYNVVIAFDIIEHLTKAELFKLQTKYSESSVQRVSGLCMPQMPRDSLAAA